MRADTIILVAWNFPLTSMKLYDCWLCCPLLHCIQGGCAEKSFLHKNVGFLPLSIVQLGEMSNLQHLRHLSKKKIPAQFLSHFHQTKEEKEKTANQNTTSTNTFQPNLCKSWRGEPHKGKIFPPLSLRPSSFPTSLKSSFARAGRQ